MKHLKESNMNYVQHWWLATSCGIVLLIHLAVPIPVKKLCIKTSVSYGYSTTRRP